MFYKNVKRTLTSVLLTATVLSPAISQDVVPSPTRSTTERGRYADGVYTARGQYGGQPSFITVTVTVSDEIITAVEVTPHATVPTSLDLQRRFAAAVPAVVVGKRLDEVRVGKLAGSSGTPDGFNDAIDQIKQQAAR